MSYADGGGGSGSGADGAMLCFEQRRRKGTLMIS